MNSPIDELAIRLLYAHLKFTGAFIEGDDIQSKWNSLADRISHDYMSKNEYRSMAEEAKRYFSSERSAWDWL